MTGIYDDRYNTSESVTRYIKQKVSDVAPTLESDDDSSKRPVTLKPSLWTSVLAGGVAGVVVDFTLYPLDTFKTRLQSKEGFRASGGFSRIYKGIIPVLLCSAPVSALFFCTYNTLINSLRAANSSNDALIYLIAASVAETLCASVRVPLEVIKQRKQTSTNSTLYIMQKILKREGLLGFYRGFSSTIIREVPFACIQYPLWEYMIHQTMVYHRLNQLTAVQTALCGGFSGAIAAMITTPLDVIKTRIMLADKAKIEYYKPHVNYSFAREIYFERGLRGFFAGVFPRTLWIMLGGFIYFGAYEKVKLLTTQMKIVKENMTWKAHKASVNPEENPTTFKTEEKEQAEQNVDDSSELKEKREDSSRLNPESRSDKGF